MNILFLDDDPTRAQVFIRENPNVTWVQTAEECISKLSESWDLVCLDHDLGDDGLGTAEYNGMHVVRWIQDNHPDVTQFHIHSWNIPAAGMMLRCLRDAGYSTTAKPFR